MSRKRWIYRNGEAVECAEREVSSGLIVIPDQQGYQSMVTGEWIGGRRQHREHLRAHDLIEVGNEKVKQKPMPDVPGRREAIRAAYEKLRGAKPSSTANAGKRTQEGA